MLISELFYSVQGEGSLTGVPSVFVRTSGCNLRCKWCDTPYASWKPEGRVYTVDEVFAAVVALESAKHVVFTGGEPMLAPELPELARRLKAEGWHITIETAGTIAPDGIVCDLASISPKLSGSTPGLDRIDQVWVKRHEETRFQPAVLKQWLQTYDFQLKFVICSPSDLDEMEALLKAVESPIPGHKVLLMPEGIDSQTLRDRSLELVEICKTRGYRFCDRLHVHLFGHTRGT
ncbi:MAG: 7-carboxy-7-deazaguanine synthase QueE [Verrucomicrobiota bacterium]